MAGAYERCAHPFAPVCGADAHTLILGSFPSVKSRETGFYYGHPQNRFWAVMACILDEPLPNCIAEKENMLLKHGVALWDALQSCEIVGSGDQSIRNAVPNDFSVLLKRAPITRVFANGQKAYALYRRYAMPQTRLPAVCLPSTSPANAAWSLARLAAAWKSALIDNPAFPC